MGKRSGDMEFEKFTERTRGFIESAQGLALRSNHQQLTPEHLLKILLDDEEGMASNLIKSGGGRARWKTRPAHRPRRGNPPHDSGAGAPHQEQSRTDRRAGRGQDRHRGRSGNPDRQWRRPRTLARQAADGPRYGLTHRRSEI